MEHTQEISATSIVALFETTKAQRQSFVSQIISEVQSGNVNPLTLHLQIKAMEDIAKQITDSPEYKEALLEEAQKYGKSFDYKSAKVEIREVGVKYDFSNCGDTKYSAYTIALENAKAKVKERETFLRNAPSGGTIVTDEETGETVTVYPPAKSSTTSVTVTLK